VLPVALGLLSLDPRPFRTFLHLTAFCLLLLITPFTNGEDTRVFRGLNRTACDSTDGLAALLALIVILSSVQEILCFLQSVWCVTIGTLSACDDNSVARLQKVC
jgi:hypothetical protein